MMQELTMKTAFYVTISSHTEFNAFLRILPANTWNIYGQRVMQISFCFINKFMTLI